LALGLIEGAKTKTNCEKFQFFNVSIKSLTCLDENLKICGKILSIH